MAGNSQRQGARRKTPKRGPRVGTGGHNRRALEGKGPTPPAEHRPGHPAARRAAAVKRAEAVRPPRPGSGQGSGQGPGQGSGEGPGRSSSAPRRPAAGRTARPGASRPGREGPETVAGRNAVVEALRAGIPATALYVATRIDSDERVREAFALVNDRGVPLLEAPRPELDRITGGAVHQGLALQVPAYSYAHPEDLLARADDAAEPALVVALDGVTDPRNLGAVLRSSAAFGGHGVLVPERRAAGVTAGTWKASAGAAARVPVARATNLTRALEDYKRAGLFVVGLDGDGDLAVDALDVAAEPLVLVVGSEGKGLSRLVRSTCDLVVRIPVSEASESLNAGVAAGIALYEVARSRRRPPSP